MAHLKFNRVKKSSVAQNIFEKNHRIGESNRIIRAVNDCKFIDAFENLEIYRNTKSPINADWKTLVTFSLFLLVEKKWK